MGIKLGNLQTVGSFSYAAEAGFNFAVRYLYAQDLNGDGLDEVVFAGFESQPNTPSNYSNTQLAIFGWKDGKFSNLTTQYLPNNIQQVEGVGDIAFADFNGDGQVDMYVSGNADMEYEVNSYAYINRGHYFERSNLGTTKWEHGVAAGDINGDGYADVVVAGYLHPSPFYMGSASGLTKYVVADSSDYNSYATHGSGVVIADFLGNGTNTLVVVDSAIGDASDTLLLRVVGGANPVGFATVAVLPIPRLELPEYGVSNPGYDNSHDIRARAMDFSGDGLVDLLVFSRAGWDGTQWPEKSQVQFLLNKGSGQFEDVTSSLLDNYEWHSNVSYTPVIHDVNGDGYADIFLSESSWGSQYQSTTLLVSEGDGTYRDAYRSQLSALVDQGGDMATLIQGPNNQWYVVTESQSTGGAAEVKIATLDFVANHGPVAKAISKVATATEGKVLTWGLPKGTFTDSDAGDVLTYSSDNLPSWLTINAATGKLTGTAAYTAADSTPYTIHITATDASGASANTTLTLSVKNTATIKGSANNDSITTGSGVDVITGLAGNDTINAGLDDDIIYGGLGNDVLTGGGGVDRFVFDAKLSATTNLDQIMDFVSGTDQLGLKSSIFAKLKGDTNLSDNFWVQGAGAQDANDYLIFNPVNSKVYYDSDGSGSQSAAVEFVELVGVNTLAYSDFLIL